MIRLKVYGLQRTGTNWTVLNIRRTWPREVIVWQNEGKWKHAIPEVVDGAQGYLICLKHPLAWMASMKRYPMAKVKDFDILAQQWNHYTRRSHEFARAHPETLLIRYNAKGGGDVLRAVRAKYGLSWPDKWHVETKVMRRNGDKTPLDQMTVPTPFAPARYTSREFESEVPTQYWDAIEWPLWYQ